MVADKKGHNVKLNDRVKQDLELANAFLKRTQGGVSMNLLTLRVPDIVYICDICFKKMEFLFDHSNLNFAPMNRKNKIIFVHLYMEM